MILICSSNSATLALRLLISLSNVTFLTLVVPTRVSFSVSLESLLVVVALLAQVELEPPVVNFQMTAEISHPGSLKVTLVTGKDLRGSLLTSDDVSSVRCVGNEGVTMRTFLYSMFPFMISELSKVASDKFTCVTSMLTGRFIIHTVVVLITDITITRRNWVYTFIIRLNHLFQDR